MADAPTPVSKHWSKVAAGEAFHMTLKYDADVYVHSEVNVAMKRNAMNGFVESADPKWQWTVNSKFGEGESKAIDAARRSRLFTPALKLQHAKKKHKTISTPSGFFFKAGGERYLSPVPVAATAGASAGASPPGGRSNAAAAQATTPNVPVIIYSHSHLCFIIHSG